MTDPCDCAENTDPRKLVRDGHRTRRSGRSARSGPGPRAGRRAPARARDGVRLGVRGVPALLRPRRRRARATGRTSSPPTSRPSSRSRPSRTSPCTARRSRRCCARWRTPSCRRRRRDMIAALGAVFDCLGTLARRLDALKAGPPGRPAAAGHARQPDPVAAQPDAPAADRLLPGRRRARRRRPRRAAARRRADPRPAGSIVRLADHRTRPVGRLARRASASPDWAAYVGASTPTPYTGAYGPAPTAVDQVNHLATHNLFTAICDTFLAAYARVVDDARAAVRGDVRVGRPRAALRAVPRVPEAARARPRRGQHAHRQAPRLLLPRGPAAAGAPGRAGPGARAGRAGQARRRAPARRAAPCSRRARTTPAPTPTSPSTATSSPTRRSWPTCKTLYRHPDSRAARRSTDDRLFADAGRDRRRVVAPVRRQGLRGRRADVDRHASRRGRLRDRVPPPLAGRGHAAHRRRPAARPSRSRRKAKGATSTCGAGSPPTKGWIEKHVDVLGRTTTRPSAWRSSSTATTRRHAVRPGRPRVRVRHRLPVLLVTLRHQDEHRWDYADLGADRAERGHAGGRGRRA